MSILSRLLRLGNDREKRAENDILTIESMRRSHLPEILQIESTAYPQPWT